MPVTKYCETIILLYWAIMMRRYEEFRDCSDANRLSKITIFFCIIYTEFNWPIVFDIAINNADALHPEKHPEGLNWNMW